MDDLPQTPISTEPPKPLVYEESPIAEPQQETPPAPAEPLPPTPTPTPVPVRKGPPCLGVLGTLVLFTVLFGIGMWLSTVIRQYVPGNTGQGSSPTNTPQSVKQPQATPTPIDPYAGWQTYQVISGSTRQPVAGVSFKLQPEVLPPLCDGSSCMSQGTYLPGGTRFTVAARGAGQALRDYRGAIVSDALGQPFTTKDTLISGRPGVNFTGSFTGTTIGGYSFSRMAGVMVPVTDTLSVEINHFTPSGVTADFDADEALFAKILGTFTITGSLGGEKGSVIPVLSPTPASSVSSTPAPLR